MLNHLSTPALHAAMDENKRGFWRHFRCLPQVEVRDDPDMMWIVTGIPYLPLNGVFLARLGPDSVDRDIETLLERFKSRRVPMLWWIGPSSRPQDMGKRLEAYGLTHDEDLPGMAIDLLTLNDSYDMPPGLIIERVGDEQTLRRYFEAWTVGFDIPQVVADAFFVVYTNQGFDEDAQMRHYVGWIGGEPVATASLFIGAEAVEVYSVSTVPDARRRGIGSAMTLAPLTDARDMGHRVGTLYATPMGLSVYRRLGFRECASASIYTWKE